MQQNCWSGVRQCERRRQLTRSRQRRTSVLGGGLLTSYPAALLLLVLVLATSAATATAAAAGIAVAVAAAGQRDAISSGPRRTKRMKNHDETREEDLRDPCLAERPRGDPSESYHFPGSGIHRGDVADHHDEKTHTREMSPDARSGTLQAFH